MDLHFTNAEPTDAERLAIDEYFAATPLREPRRQLLLPALQAVQARIGWISPGALNHLCRALDVPPAEAFGVADFYALLSTRKQPSAMVHACDDVGCRVRGAEAFCAELDRRYGPEGDNHRDVGWRRSPCLGLCERAPAALVVVAGEEPLEQCVAPADVASVARVLAGDPIDAPPVSWSVPQAGDASLRLLSRIGRVDSGSLESYRAAGGFAALARAIEIGPEAVVEEVVASRLLGRGGAAFPAGVKWKAVRQAAAPRYLICNADESEPGTFKDRVLMEWDPFAVIEAMSVAGYAAGCARGYLYVRGEYPLAARRLSEAIEQCRAAGLLDADVFGSGFGFDIELRRGAGAYICGEETALMNSIEGYRGEPRNKPPFPTEVGLFGRPTLVNNVETLVNVLDIVLRGGESFAVTGTEKSTGTKLFCVSGHVNRPGVYEVPFGITIGELLSLAGGIGGTGRLRAVMLGGAAGSFVGEEALQTPLTFEGLRAIGAALGSAVVMAFDDATDLAGVLSRIAAFFRDESCGQCVPCRVGTVRQEELLQRLARNGSIQTEVALLADLSQVMRDASICGLGHTAASAISSALARWPEVMKERR
jgi:NADH-quinone oxidoreductase subunit F